VASDRGLTYKDCLRMAEQLEGAAVSARELADEYAAEAASWRILARARADCCNRCDGRPSSYSCGSSFCRCTVH
jgi:hypothetical protein